MIHFLNLQKFQYSVHAHAPYASKWKYFLKASTWSPAIPKIQTNFPAMYSMISREEEGTKWSKGKENGKETCWEQLLTLINSSACLSKSCCLCWSSVTDVRYLRSTIKAVMTLTSRTTTTTKESRLALGEKEEIAPFCLSQVHGYKVRINSINVIPAWER